MLTSGLWRLDCAAGLETGGAHRDKVKWYVLGGIWQSLMRQSVSGFDILRSNSLGNSGIH